MSMSKLANLYMLRRARLTPQYTVINYIQSTGTQYIDTGYYPLLNTMDISVDFSPMGGTYLFGSSCSISGVYRRYGFYWANQASFRVLWSSSQYDISGITFPVDSRRILRANARVISVDGVVKATYAAYATRLTQSLTLGATVWVATQGVVSYGKAKFYGCKIDEGSFHFDFVPRLDALGVPCMLDLMSGQAYYNAGTGSFLYG